MAPTARFPIFPCPAPKHQKKEWTICEAGKQKKESPQLVCTWEANLLFNETMVIYRVCVSLRAFGCFAVAKERRKRLKSILGLKTHTHKTIVLNSRFWHATVTSCWLTDRTAGSAATREKPFSQPHTPQSAIRVVFFSLPTFPDDSYPILSSVHSFLPCVLSRHIVSRF